MKEFIVQFQFVKGEPINFCYVKSLYECHKYTEYHWREWVYFESLDKKDRDLLQDIFAIKLFLCSTKVEIGDKFKSIYYPDKEFVSIEVPPDRNGDPSAENLIDRFESVTPKECYLTMDGSHRRWIPYNEGYKIIGEILSDEINVGDRVVVIYTDGYKPTGDLDIGILTRKWEEEPYCEIDGKPIDLASEGHSSTVCKLNIL